MCRRARELLDGGEVLREEPRRRRPCGTSAGRSSARTSRRRRRRGAPAARAPSSVASIAVDVATPCSCATCRSSAANAGADVVHQVGDRAAAGRPASMKPSRRWTQVALDLRLAGAPQVLARDRRRRRTDRRRTRAACARMISPYSSGNASSERRNSSLGRRAAWPAAAAPIRFDRARTPRGRSTLRRLDEREAGQRRLVDAFEMRSVRHHRPQPRRRRRAAGRDTRVSAAARHVTPWNHSTSSFVVDVRTCD